MGATSKTGGQRTALGNHDLVRHVVAQLLAITAEWTIALGVLVHAYHVGGATATGLASISLLAPYVLVGPLAGALATRYPPQRIRVLGLVLQTTGYGIAALAAALALPLPLVLLPAATAVAAITSLRPTAAMVLPGIVRSSRELTVGNLWGGYCETIGTLGGPLLATALLGLGGAELTIGACAVLTLGALVALHVPRPIDPPAAAPDGGDTRVVHLAISTLGVLRARPGALTVLAVAGAQFLVVGALEILVVVIAEEEFDLGPSAPGWLQAAFGVGAITSGLLATRLTRRRRQARAIAVAVGSIGVLSLLLAGVLTPVAAFMILPIVGLSQGLADVLADVLLHRSAPPERLGAVYALLEFSAGAGLIIGSLLTQVAIAVSGPRLAFLCVGVFLLLLVAFSVRGLRAADASAEVPVVQMSLLRRVSLFAPLPTTALEDVARTATELDVDRGTALIVQGEVGDRFFVVAHGSFDVTSGDEILATIGRGGSFGEIALLADVERTATVTATEPASVLAVERRPFLVAVTGHDSSRQAAWGIMRARRGNDLPIAGPHEFAEADQL